MHQTVLHCTKLNNNTQPCTSSKNTPNHVPGDDNVIPIESYIIHEDFRSFVRSAPPPSVTLRGPPLISEMGWTGELWSKTKFLILEN